MFVGSNSISVVLAYRSLRISAKLGNSGTPSTIQCSITSRMTRRFENRELSNSIGWFSCCRCCLERERERDREKGHIKVSGTLPLSTSSTSTPHHQTHLLLECLPSYPNIHHTPRPPSSSPSSSPRPRWRS